MTAGKVLITLSDAHSFSVQKPDGDLIEEETEFFLMELTKPPYVHLLVQFASPKGEQPNMDSLSESLLDCLGNFWERKRELQLVDKVTTEDNPAHPIPFSELSDAPLEAYTGVFIPGGHAQTRSWEGSSYILHTRGRPTGGYCQQLWKGKKCGEALTSSPCGDLSRALRPSLGQSGPNKHKSDGWVWVQGYKITSWSDTGEKVVGTLKGGEIERVESSLCEAGADMRVGAGKKASGITVDVDRRVVSGANPMATTVLGNPFIGMLDSRREKSVERCVDIRNAV